MPSVFRLADPRRHFLDDQAAPLTGGKLFVYSSGTTTKLTLYSDASGSVTTANPVVLDSRGELPSEIYAESGAYKMVLAPSDDTDPPGSAIWTADELTAINDLGAGTITEWTPFSGTPTYVTGSSFTLSGDQTSTFHVGRRLEIVHSGGTGYGTITSSSYSAPNTTISVGLDVSDFSSPLTSVAYSISSADDESAPASIVQLDKTLASSDSTVAFTDLLAGYSYEIWLSNIQPDNDGVAFECQVAVGGSWQTGSGDYRSQRTVSAGTSATAERTTTDSSMSIGSTANTLGSGTDEFLSGVVRIHQPLTGVYPTLTWSVGYYSAAPESVRVDGWGQLIQNNAIDGIRFRAGSGNISGRFVVFRRKGF